MAVVGNNAIPSSHVPSFVKELKDQLYQLLEEDLGEFIFNNGTRIPSIWVEDQPPPRNAQQKLAATGGVVCLISPQYQVLASEGCRTPQSFQTFQWLITLLWYGNNRDIQAHFYQGAMEKIRMRFRDYRETILQVEEGAPQQVTYRISFNRIQNNFSIF